MESLSSSLLSLSAAAVQVMLGIVVYYHYQREIDTIIARWYKALAAYIARLATRGETLTIDADGKMRWLR